MASGGGGGGQFLCLDAAIVAIVMCVETVA